MKKIISNIKNAIYIFGIVIIFAIEVVNFHEWFDKKSSDWYFLILIVIAFYSTCIMIIKIIKSKDYLIGVRSTIYNKQLDNDAKLNAIEYQMYDIDAFLNDK